MKKIAVLLTVLLLLTSCSTPQKEKTVVLFLPNSYERWIQGEDMDTIIENDRIDKVNDILKKAGKHYKIEIHTIPAKDLMVTYTQERNEIQKRLNLFTKLQEKNADITSFESDVPIYKKFVSLNEYIEDTDAGKKLRKDIPDNIYKVNMIDKKLFHIPKPVVSYSQNRLYMKTDVYQQYKYEIDARNNCMVDMIQYMSDNYELKENEVLTTSVGGFSSQGEFLLPDYALLKGTPLYINRETKEVVNPLENDDFQKYYQLSSYIQCRKQDTSRLTASQRNNQNFDLIFKSFSGQLNTITYDTTQDFSNYTLVYESEKYPVMSSGLGVLESSKNKDDAFGFLCFLNTNQEIANVFVYGTDYAFDENNNVIIKEEDSERYIWGGYGGMLGSFINSSPNKYQKANKKEIVFEDANNVNMDLYVPEILDISNMIDSINKIFSVFYSSIALNSYSMDNESECIMYGLNRVEKEKEEMKQAGVDSILQELQQQVNEYIK